MHLFYALEVALENILNEGVETRFANLRYKANLLRQGMLDLNLNFLIDQNKMSSILTTVYVPSYMNISNLRDHLRDQSIIIYEGKGCFKGKVFQVGNIGELSYKDIRFFLDTLKNILLSYQPVNKNILLLDKCIIPELDEVNIAPELSVG